MLKYNSGNLSAETFYQKGFQTMLFRVNKEVLYVQQATLLPFKLLNLI